jgi:FKBP-type peptidyl-prolyl cis-trans isomerase
LIQWEAAKPLEFKLGEEGAAVPGFDLAAGSMSLCERASFSIPADLCYGIKVLPPLLHAFVSFTDCGTGAEGKGETIPPNEGLEFDMELVGIDKNYVKPSS